MKTKILVTCTILTLVLTGCVHTSSHPRQEHRFPEINNTPSHPRPHPNREHHPSPTPQPNHNNHPRPNHQPHARPDQPPNNNNHARPEQRPDHGQQSRPNHRR